MAVIHSGKRTCGTDMVGLLFPLFARFFVEPLFPLSGIHGFFQVQNKSHGGSVRAPPGMFRIKERYDDYLPYVLGTNRNPTLLDLPGQTNFQQDGHGEVLQPVRKDAHDGEHSRCIRRHPGQGEFLLLGLLGLDEASASQS